MPEMLLPRAACRVIVIVIVAIALAAAVMAAAAGLFILCRGARVKASQPCWSKLVNLQGAKEQWALETHAAPNQSQNDRWSETGMGCRQRKDQRTAGGRLDLLSYLSKFPKCPAGEAYIIGTLGELPKCSHLGHDYLGRKWTSSHFAAHQRLESH